METKSVIVTFYFNLKELSDVSKGTRPPEFYMNAGRGTLQMDYPMIIFCDQVTYPAIKNIRDELVIDPSKTVYVIKPITEYDFFKINWPIVRRHRIKSTRNPEDRNTASYLLTTTFKIVALKIAAERKDFDATHYFWVDFGCSHIVYKETMKMDLIRALDYPLPKIRILYIRYWSKAEIRNTEQTLLAGLCGLATTIFSVESDLVDKLYAAWMAVFYDHLFNEWGHADEQIMSYCYHKWPQMFNIYYGDYYSVISNYHHVRNDWHLIKYALINPAITDGSKILAKGAINAILDGYEAGVLTIHHSEITELRNQLERLSQ